MSGRAYWLHALSGLHVGSGTGVGFVDQPLLRERITEWPYVPGTSVKGVVAAHHGAEEEKRRGNRLRELAFGLAPSARDNDLHGQAGALVFSDARLLCLPVTSFHGTFAWTTCGLALCRLKRDLEGIGLTEVPPAPADDILWRTGTSKLNDQSGTVYLEDTSDVTQSGAEASAWATFLAGKLFPAKSPWITLFAERFLIIPGDRFKHFAKYACEVVPRIKIRAETKTVETGKLWLEELAPAESIFTGVVWCDSMAGAEQQNLLSSYCGGRRTLQFGGKASTGRGRTEMIFTE